jgi:hypothetical protein
MNQPIKRIAQEPRVEVTAALRLTESELRALDALVGYGADAFIKVFYEHMGKHYMQPHEGGLRSLFEMVREQVPTILRRTDAAREAFNPKAAT